MTSVKLFKAYPILFVITILLSNSTANAQSRLQFCNAVQSKVGFIRYPMGTVGVWSTEFGEIADVMTRMPRLYPCADTVVIKGEDEEWRSSVTGDPSILNITYKFEKPAGATAAEITVTPHVSVFRYTFLERTHKRNVLIDLSKMNVESWAYLNKWTNRNITRIDERTFHATIGTPGNIGAYYIIKFSTPCKDFGVVCSSGKIENGISKTEEAQAMYVRFDTATMTVAVSVSFTSFDKAQEYLDKEFTDFDSAHLKCALAWEQVLDQVKIEGSENSKRMAYTALYSIYSNIINANEGSYYAGYCSNPVSISSSAFWQFISGYQSCAFDNSHATYPFLMLAYPEIMTDVVNTYLARYKRDGFVYGNSCLYTGAKGTKHDITYTPQVAIAAYTHNIKADYAALYDALKNNFNDTSCVPARLSDRGYLASNSGDRFPLSTTLELAASAHSMSILAKSNNEQKQAKNYLDLSRVYHNLWDSENYIFRVKNNNGTWGVINNKYWTWDPNPQGLFEGTNRDYSFDVPHDPYGLINLPEQENFVSRLVDYCTNEAWFNDFSYVYPYLLYYADAANKAQRILRKLWIPLFNDGVMYENVCAKPPHNGWNEHYTSNSAWLLCSMTGLYPVNSPAGQYIITSPSVTKTEIRPGNKSITVQTKNNSEDNIYINSIKLDDKVYPCYMIPVKRIMQGAKIDLEMSSDPTQGLGALYISSSDGYIVNAELVSDSHLKCTIAAAVIEATTRIYSHVKPDIVLVSGQKSKNWDYEKNKKILTIKTTDTAEIEIILD
ncbi:MAG: glycoside hydrolase family 92 protein [Bacteroidales bacterium]|nr:MAG: glycoside hydrolase family 92 protein [Bacteroidales bacterium]